MNGLIFIITAISAGNALQGNNKIKQPWQCKASALFCKKILMKFIFVVLLTTAALVPASAQLPLWKTVPMPVPMPDAADSGTITVNGITMYYAIFGKDKPGPVMLLHGGFTSSDYWSSEVRALATRHEVIVADSRGHGRSTLGTQRLSYKLMANDVLKLMDALHLKQCAVAGWSDGGIIGLLLAIHYPERISRLFTFGTNYNLSGYSNEPPDTLTGKKFMAMAKANYRRLSPTPDSFPALQKALGDMYNREPDIAPAELRTINCAATIAAGEHDQFIKREHTEELARLIPGAKLVIIPNVGHGGVLQDTAAFHKAITDWLSN